MHFHIDIVSLKGTIYSGEIQKITLPSLEGDMTVLSRHMPIVAPLGVGEVLVNTPNGTLNMSIGKGVFEFSKGRARLLIEDVTSSDDISEQNALEAKKRAEELLEKGIVGEGKLQAMYALRKSFVDLKIVRRRKRKIV
ncbi:MAG: ATP synthase epsilon chain [Candidatus Woesebacteria bacterium GW2011_GWB1_38_8]|uniref:ATP synthase epsilon chain n=1 Tax=Candidatus Woesebacteria bacterium GW2011_GWB1_38_8 TaxID=1618570 RepID=A0A0G0L5C9_9BACT|nr:MAG: ATP synthase epsilon chain [Candidatus Woesebacteria bacterium GW2011_GWB1_38_8]